MKKAFQYYYLGLFTVVLLLPVLFFGVFRSHFDTNNYENRTLAQFPVLGEYIDGVPVTIQTFPGMFDSWFNDHLPFRNQLLTLNGRLDYEVLGTSSSESVIVGKDGWLFYKGAQVNDEDPIGDYQGTDLFTEEELQTIAANMMQAKADVEARGARFVVFLCPNKERVYSEYMPDAYGEPATQNRLQQVMEYLQQNTDVTVVGAYDDLMAYKQEHPEDPIYYKYDTHWNNVGAYVGVRSLNEALGYDMVPLEECGRRDDGEGSFDLARLIHLGNYLTDDHLIALEDYTPHKILMEMNETGTEFRYFTDDTAPGRKLFIIGDSFSATSAPYYGCHFQETYVNFYYNYKLEQLEAEQPDTVVYECVERYLGNMLHFSIVDGIQAEPEQ